MGRGGEAAFSSMSPRAAPSSRWKAPPPCCRPRSSSCSCRRPGLHFESASGCGSTGFKSASGSLKKVPGKSRIRPRHRKPRSGRRMRVHVVADNSVKLAEVLAIVDRHHAVLAELLSQASGRRDQCQALVARVDLRAVENINLLKNVLSSSKSAEKRIFLLDRAAHLDVAQAYALGATLVLAGPLDPARLLRALADGAAANAASSSRDTEDENAAAAFGAAAIAAMFAAAAKSVAVDVAGTKMAGSGIAQHVAEKGLSDWLPPVCRHTEGTYQHCLLV